MSDDSKDDGSENESSHSVDENSLMEEEVESDEEKGSLEGDGDGEDNDGGKDGFADAMAKVLGQTVASSAPVLAKRKTTQMKAIENDRLDRAALRDKRLKRKEQRDKQLVTPDMKTADHERQLKRIATRGVVALFNAIAKAKRESSAVAEDEERKNLAERAAISGEEIRRMTQTNFLDMLKGSKERETTLKKDEGKVNAKEREKQKVQVERDGESSGSDEDGRRPQGWRALSDHDYFTENIGASNALKGWDKQLDSDDDSDGALPDPFQDTDDKPKITKGRKQIDEKQNSKRKKVNA